MNESNNYWLNVAVDEILREKPDGKLTVSSGISPSANYHIGHYREILTAEALAWGLRRAGRDVEHVHVVDDMDPLRKRYDFLPSSYEQYVGWPICLIPSPEGEGSYADYFLHEFTTHFEQMGIAPDKIIRSYRDLYQSGAMVQQIETVLNKLDTVRDVFSRFGRKVPVSWAPIQFIDGQHKLVDADPSTWDKSAQTINGVDYRKGAVKLNWRLDWPARWAELGVDVEPFSAQEHGAAGGSYDTGFAFAKEVFGIDAPLPGARYGTVHLGNDTKKMSSSKGNIVTPKEALSIISPDILRYFIVRSRPEKALQFDPGAKLVNLIDEYKQVKSAAANSTPHEFADAYEFADMGTPISTVPFAHLVSVYQAALGDNSIARNILARTGYDIDEDILRVESTYVANWLERYAPDSVKFSVASDLPDVDLSKQQRDFLHELAEKISAESDVHAEWVHETIYSLKEAHELSPAESFRAIYRVILGQDSGPKAGWFLTTLDKQWLVNRLKLKA